MSYEIVYTAASNDPLEILIAQESDTRSFEELPYEPLLGIAREEYIRNTIAQQRAQH